MSKPAREPRITKKAVRAARAQQAIPHPGLQFSHKHHVFIAKAKRGELWALNHLSPVAKAAITPLFEVWPPSIPKKKKDGKPPKPPKTLPIHVNDLLVPIRDDWGALPFFLDTRYVVTGGIPAPMAAKAFFDRARALNLAFIPVTQIRFAPAFQQEIRDAIAQDNRGVMIRLLVADFSNPALGNLLAALLGVLQVTPEQTDILIDLERKSAQFEVQTVGSAALLALPSLNQWRTVTLAAGCFPPSISSLGHGTWHPVSRSDWLGWSQVLSQQTAANSRRPSYGDYGVRCGGNPRDIPNRPDPNIRYTANPAVLVRRETKANGKLKLICSSLITLPEFSGAPFSQGDSELAARAAMPGSPSNSQAEQWIQWCTNHHLELTASQIQNLP